MENDRHVDDGELAKMMRQSRKSSQEAAAQAKCETDMLMESVLKLLQTYKLKKRKGVESDSSPKKCICTALLCINKRAYMQKNSQKFLKRIEWAKDCSRGTVSMISSFRSMSKARAKSEKNDSTFLSILREQNNLYNKIAAEGSLPLLKPLDCGVAQIIFQFCRYTDEDKKRDLAVKKKNEITKRQKHRLDNYRPIRNNNSHVPDHPHFMNPRSTGFDQDLYPSKF